MDLTTHRRIRAVADSGCIDALRITVARVTDHELAELVVDLKERVETARHPAHRERHLQRLLMVLELLTERVLAFDLPIFSREVKHG